MTSFFFFFSEDGGWNNWSDWSKCQQVGGDPMVDQCLCRSRSCDSPKPTNGGRPCVGAGIEVANCTSMFTYCKLSDFLYFLFLLNAFML